MTKLSGLLVTHLAVNENAFWEVASELDMRARKLEVLRDKSFYVIQPQPALMATQPREPLSPWAQRYGVVYEDAFTLGDDKLRHSGYHTGHPRLDPKFYAEPIPQPEIDECAKFKHQNDIHKLFHIEHKQYGDFKGIKPWQYGPLMQYVRFSDRGLLPGGHWRTGEFLILEFK
ncbi:hypothetical protein CHU98_g5555 [Xylaria longipes]|nr:hypothetical protein CHU98_g5555 [Xylaria longipes]